MRLYNVYASGQTRKGLPPIRCLERWRKDGRYFRQRTHMRLYNLYASFQTRKGISPIRWPEICGYTRFTQAVRHGKVYRRSDVQNYMAERWPRFPPASAMRLCNVYASFQTRKGISPIRWPEICGYIRFTQAVRHGKVYRRSDVQELYGGKMAEISASERNAVM